MKRKSVKPIYSMCVQPSFIIGTNNEDGSFNFAPITWVSATHEDGDGYLRHRFDSAEPGHLLRKIS